MFFFWFRVFLWTCKYFYCHCIYNCVKTIDFLCWVYRKPNYFFSFHSMIFQSKIHKRRGIFLRKGGMATHEQWRTREGEGIKNWKFWANVLLECPLKEKAYCQKIYSCIFVSFIYTLIVYMSLVNKVIQSQTAKTFSRNVN